MVWSATTGVLASSSTRCSTAPRPSPTWRGRSSTPTPTSCGTPRSRSTSPRTHRSISSRWCKDYSSQPGLGLVINSWCGISSSPASIGQTFRTLHHHTFLRFHILTKFGFTFPLGDDSAMLILKRHFGVFYVFNLLNLSLTQR